VVEDADGLWRREEVMGAKASVEARRMERREEENFILDLV
jgi:hypothetical protein